MSFGKLNESRSPLVLSGGSYVVIIINYCIAGIYGTSQFCWKTFYILFYTEALKVNVRLVLGKIIIFHIRYTDCMKWKREMINSWHSKMSTNPENKIETK